MPKHVFIGSLVTLATIVLLPGLAFAHVIVTPGQAGIGEELVFNVSVPNERASAVSSVKLVIPRGVTDVTPTVKDGWTIETTSNGNTDDPEVAVITWTAGNIPVGQREDFSFGAQMPAQATQLDWKAYQTYADGTVVHWDQKPAGSDDATGNAGPYSVTRVVDDLTSSSAPAISTSTLALVLSVAAVVISLGSFLVRRR